jgi:hypothetical protein
MFYKDYDKAVYSAEMLTFNLSTLAADNPGTLQLLKQDHS